MGIRLFSNGLDLSPALPEHPNGDALGVSGAGVVNNHWRFSRVTSDAVIGTTVQSLVKGSKGHLHLGESEITGYLAGVHGGQGLIGLKFHDSAGKLHTITEIVGDDDVTREECAAYLADFFPQYHANDPMRVIVRSSGKSGEGTGSIVDIHGREAKAGAGLPAGDLHIRTDLGGCFTIQIKVLSRNRKNESGRFGTNGEQIVESVNSGREIVLMLARRDDLGRMTVRFLNAGAIMRKQMEKGVEIEGPIGVPVHNGGPLSYKLHGKDMTGKEVRSGGKVAHGTRPFYLKYARGGTATMKYAPRMPLYFSGAAIDRFLITLSKDERAELDSGWQAFSPNAMPAWIGSCIY
jgi:hypothetical protein